MKVLLLVVAVLSIFSISACSQNTEKTAEDRQY
jgi:uncharacterized lipoprotein